MDSPMKNQSKQIAKNMFSYPQKVIDKVAKYSARISLNQLKNISKDRIKNQFQVIESAVCPYLDKIICQGEMNKNRYINILPYFHNRVTFSKYPKYYVNASEIPSIVDGQIFAIFGQAPLPNCFGDFWLMVYEKKIEGIVMLCSLFDPNRGNQADAYWPQKSKQLQFSQYDLKVELVKSEQSSELYKQSYFKVIGPNGNHYVKHMHVWESVYSGWDGRIWANLWMVNECLAMIQKKQMLLIHCSAGVGRSGTLGAVIESLRCANQFKQLSIFEIVTHLRKYRIGCVQNLQQYSYIYSHLSKHA